MIQALESPPACPKSDCQLQGKAGAMQERGVFVLLCRTKAGSQARGGRSLVFTFNWSMYPRERPRTGARGPWQDYVLVFVCTHSVRDGI